MYKILISGYYGFNNIGDEAVLRTVIDNLRNNMDDIDITILSQNPEDTREKYGVHAQPRMSLPKIIKAVKSCDMLISGGGSLLQDTTSKISILYYLFIIRLALLFKKKVFIYSQGIGPINSSFNRALTARFLKRVDGIAVRDEKSAQFLQQIGIPGESINVTADPVLRLEKAELSSGRKILDNIGCTKEPGFGLSLRCRRLRLYR
jgi:polysaccharide pyruvyl transferase CsaB